MEISVKEKRNEMPGNPELQEIACHFSKLEYLHIQGELSERFINNFVQKLPNLKYFSIEDCEQSFFEIVELLKQNLAYRVKKREITAQNRSILPYHNNHLNEADRIVISSQNAIARIKCPTQYLFLKKLVKKGDAYIPIYFAYDTLRSIDCKWIIWIVCEKIFNEG